MRNEIRSGRLAWLPLLLVAFVAAACSDGRQVTGPETPAQLGVVDGPPVDIPGQEGCTPGYWKNHDWPVAYSPGDLFSSVFGSGFPGMTLEDVLTQGGGHWTALGRHIVAGLLNAAHPDVNYLHTEAEVIDFWDEANATGNWEGYKDMLEVHNESGCPL